MATPPSRSWTVRATTRSDWCLIASHGQSGLSDWNVSSVVQKVIVRASTSLMIVRARTSRLQADIASLRYQRVLAPLDSSARAECVLPLAAGLARMPGTQILLAHVVQRPPMPRRTPLSREDTELADRIVERNRSEAEQYLDGGALPTAAHRRRDPAFGQRPCGAFAVRVGRSGACRPGVVERAWLLRGYALALWRPGRQLCRLWLVPAVDLSRRACRARPRPQCGTTEGVRAWHIRRPYKNSRDRWRRRTTSVSTNCVSRRTPLLPSGEAAPGPGVNPWLLAGLKAQEALLQSTVVALRTGSGQEALSHAAEWLLDNYYLAQQSLRQIREDMPRGFYRQLPKLAAGPLQGYPRIYDLAQQLVASSDARLDLEQVQRFVWLYQDVRPLTTGELWALPVMLRLSILTVLAQAADQITRHGSPVAETPTKGGPPPLTLAGAFTGDEVVANCFTSLRAIATYDWMDFFEHVSRVEQILRGDPADVYAGMDRATRNRYRKVIEDLALATGQSELEVARMADTLAQAAWTDSPATLEPSMRARGPGRCGRRGRGWMCRRPHTWATTCWTMAARRSRTGWATGLRRQQAWRVRPGSTRRGLPGPNRRADAAAAGRGRRLRRRAGWLGVARAAGRCAGCPAGTGGRGGAG